MNINSTFSVAWRQISDMPHIEGAVYLISNKNSRGTSNQKEVISLFRSAEGKDKGLIEKSNWNLRSQIGIIEELNKNPA